MVSSLLCSYVELLEILKYLAKISSTAFFFSNLLKKITEFANRLKIHTGHIWSLG
jgi:hypothetical protein